MFMYACSLMAMSCTTAGIKTKEDQPKKEPNMTGSLDNDSDRNIIAGSKKKTENEKNNVIEVKDENSIIENSVVKKEIEVMVSKKKNWDAPIKSNLKIEGESSKLIISKIKELQEEQNALLESNNPENIKMVSLQNALLNSYENWKGTKYVFGGDSASGIDCSALTRRIYREVFNHELPRRSVNQAQAGKRVNLSNLKPGDILYFRPEGRTNHTAVYLGNSLFINASSSKGVILSSLESSYWGKYFKHGVRVSNLA